ncbi:MAG TPA: GNAT family N-acetyltransferase [Microthrixaceae bacterium]|nr:GNAT family N-acetyltransferase [Microthrixaceae bacterium]HMT25403.1 GNAT family N-acetyltransferase [Microthrixaceae bacterium]HMT61399.1 GNAT family N-acetyltransferase [Microthrixaceae bacterium]
MDRPRMGTQRYRGEGRSRIDVETVVAADLASLADDWDRLALTHGAGPFSGRAWVEAWNMCLVPDAERWSLVARDSLGAVVGMLHLADTTRDIHRMVQLPLRYVGLAGAGVGAGEHLGPLCGSDDVAAALFGALGTIASRRTILLENLQPKWADLAGSVLGAVAVRSTPCPVNVRSEGATFSSAWTPRMRKNVRRRGRRLAELGAQLRWVDAADEADFLRALDELGNVHADRWRASSDDGGFGEQRRRFIAEVARRSVGVDRPRILLIERHGEVLAALLALRFGTSLSIYKTGWNAAYANLSPGILAGAEAMRLAEDEGLLAVDYLRGERPHKHDLGCRPVADLTVLRPHGVGGRILEARERSSHDGLVPPWVDALRGALERAKRRRPSAVGERGE